MRAVHVAILVALFVAGFASATGAHLERCGCPAKSCTMPCSNCCEPNSCSMTGDPSR